MTRVWWNGTLVAARDVRIDPADRGFTLGDGVFETVRVVAGRPMHEAAHLRRLRHGAGVLGIPLPFSDDVLGKAFTAVAGGADCALRLTLTRGPMARGVLPRGVAVPTILISAGPLPGVPAPARVMISGITRRNELSPLARVKSLNYLDGILARMDAEAAGFDDAILLNTRGVVAEATASSVVLLIDGTFVTPPVEDGALPGIARGILLERGIAREGRVTVEGLACARAGVLVNSLGIRRLGCVGSRVLADEEDVLERCTVALSFNGGEQMGRQAGRSCTATR